MTVSLPITQAPTDPEPDIRHYTKWRVKQAPVVANSTAENPAPEDPGSG
jgi:hypothetical protein